jgi:hypothetical protein
MNSVPSLKIRGGLSMANNENRCNSGIGIWVEEIPDLCPLAQKRCIYGTAKEVLKAREPEATANTQDKVKNFLQENGLSPELPPRILGPLPLDAMLADQDECFKMIARVRKDEVVEGEKSLNAEVHGHCEGLLGGLKAEIGRTAQDHFRKLKERLDSQVSAEIDDGINIRAVIEYLDKTDQELQVMLSELRSQAVELHVSVKEAEDEIGKASQRAVHEAHSFLAGRAKRMQKAARSLGNAMLMKVYSMALKETHDETMKYLDDLTIYCREQRRLYEQLLDNFRQISTTCQEAIRDNSLTHMDGNSGFGKPIPDETEIGQIIIETLGFTPEETPLETLVKLAGALRQSIPSWPSCGADELMIALEDFFYHRLASLAGLDLKRFLTWRAEKRGQAQQPSVIGREVAVGMLQRSGVWLPLIAAELPDGGSPVIALLELPGVGLAPFFRQEDLPGVEIHFQGVMPSEIVLVKIKIGIPKEAVRMWSRYENAYNQTTEDIPILPEGLLLPGAAEIESAANGMVAILAGGEADFDGHKPGQAYSRTYSQTKT